MSNQEIALELGVRVRTVKGHLVSVFAKIRKLEIKVTECTL